MMIYQMTKNEILDMFNYKDMFNYTTITNLERNLEHINTDLIDDELCKKILSFCIRITNDNIINKLKKYTKKILLKSKKTREKFFWFNSRI